MDMREEMVDERKSRIRVINRNREERGIVR